MESCNRSVLYAAPALEPVTLAEVKLHIRQDSGTFADQVSMSQCIKPGSQGIAAAYSLVGTGIDVLGYDSLVMLNAGTCGTGGTVDAKIQESDDNITYTDWTGGAFTQVTEANDTAVYEKQYTGTKQYIRAAVTVAVAACSFGVSIIKNAPTSTEDDLITAYITSAREQVETELNRAIIEQTRDFYLDGWPSGDAFKLGWGTLISVTSLTYYATDDTAATLTQGTDFDIDTATIPGIIRLRYGKSWPSTTLRPTNPIIIRAKVGYGAARASVPGRVKTAIKILSATMYQQREDIVTGTIVAHLGWLDALLTGERVMTI